MRFVQPAIVDVAGWGVYQRDSNGELERVHWESTWANKRFLVDRRKVERRRTANAATVERRKHDRRNDLRCELCLQVFASRAGALAHLPCRANQGLKHLGFYDFIRGIAERGAPSIAEADQLRKIMAASLSEDAYAKSCAERLLPSFSGKRGEERRKQYRMEWLASLLAFIRPNEINPNMLSGTDGREISRIAETFVRLPDGPQRKIIRQLFPSTIALEEIGKSGRLPARPISDKTRQALMETTDLTGKRRADALTHLEADYWSPKTPREAYDEDPVAFSRDLYRLKSSVIKKRRSFHGHM
ncbi:MAG: hypothetical protein ACREBU_08875 [Nitrososphaera sp.]